MILSNVQITNYKQYADEHDIPIPSAATVGVIGANGVGKTTLFEAIEWCLYNPSSIPAKDVRPRGRSGYTKVVVTLDVPGMNEQYLVERELKRASTDAVIRRVEPDGEETTVVQGTRQVTDYVEKKLVGLSHSAFTATFFTRQKELSFFGDLGATARRREVGKLLGLETIRDAQQLIAQDRASALNEAKVLRGQYDAQSKGRDFPAEIDAAARTIEASRGELTQATTDADAARTAREAAEKTLTSQQDLKDRDGAFAQQLTELRGKLHAAVERRDTITTELARLDGREQERADLVPLADRAEALGREEERLEGLRKTALRRRELEQVIAGTETRRRDAITALQRIVTTLTPPSPLDGWTWANGDGEDPISACQRLVVTIDGIDLGGMERDGEALSKAATTHKALQEQQAELRRYHDARAKLDTECEELLRGGDPNARRETLSRQIEEIQHEEARLRAEIAQQDANRNRVTGIANRLREQNFGDACPTCYRPFQPGDVEVTLQAFGAQLREIIAARSDAAAALTKAQGKRVDLGTERKALQATIDKLTHLNGRIANSVSVITGQEAKVDGLSRDLDGHLRALGRTDPPAEQDVTRIRAELQSWRRITDTRGTIEQSRTTLVTLVSEADGFRRQLDGIGPVDYDEAAHAQVRTGHRDALRAQATVAQIDRDLARRPQLIADRDAAISYIGETEKQVATVTQERAALGFDPVRLEEARVVARQAGEDERIATERRHRVERTLHEAQHTHDTLVRDQERIAGLAKEADARQHDHDVLDHMYREFTEFERFAARWYAPRLSEITSELVAEVTDGKYDRIVFDDNFGIDIYDGEEEKFPLETFSGGERDVIALCARIALSRVIGGQGAHPPGFLVLDEVFGSLDRDRRARLLDMLGTLTNSGEHFRQIFMISHLDDVRLAPIFDELWQVIETEDGSSTIHNLAPGADIGEL